LHRGGAFGIRRREGGPDAGGLAVRGCESGSANGCFPLGLMYDKGQGVKADPALATAL
jgi:TPR repeat protein